MYMIDIMIFSVSIIVMLEVGFFFLKKQRRPEDYKRLSASFIPKLTFLVGLNRSDYSSLWITDTDSTPGILGHNKIDLNPDIYGARVSPIVYILLPYLGEKELKTS